MHDSLNIYVCSKGKEKILNLRTIERFISKEGYAEGA